MKVYIVKTHWGDNVSEIKIVYDTYQKAVKYIQIEAQNIDAFFQGNEMDENDPIEVYYSGYWMTIDVRNVE